MRVLNTRSGMLKPATSSLLGMVPPSQIFMLNVHCQSAISHGLLPNEDLSIGGDMVDTRESSVRLGGPKDSGYLQR